jgi:hypothetical protein
MFLSMIADPFGWYNIIPIDANIIFTDAILAMELTMVILVIVSWIRLVDKVGVFRRALSNKQDENQSASVHDQFGSHGKQGSIPYLWVAYVAIGVLWVIVIVGSVLETHYKLGWQSDLLKLLAYNVIGTTILFVGWFYGLTIYYFIRKIHGMHVETIKSSADFQYRNSILTDSDSWAIEKKSTKSSMALATVPERKVTLNSELNTPLLQASESTMQGVPTTREGRLLRNQQLRIARAEHVSRQRELKLQSIIKFMGFGSVCNVIFFGITSEKMLYDFDYQWTDFVECAPPEPTTIFSSCFIYVLEWLVLIGFLYAFREPIKPRRRRRPRGRKQIQRERKPKPGQKPRRARTNPALQRR